MTWEVNYSAQLSYRLKLISGIGADRDLVLKARKYYASNPTVFIEDLCVTVDPRAELKLMPFILFPKQKEFIEYLQSCLADKEGGLTEKCRDMGATWLCCAFAVWLWLFTKEASIGFGSSKEIKVDKIGDMDSIFEKIRTIIRYLPWWIMPEGFNERQNLSYMKILNPENNALIKGEAGDNIGRGGRSLMYFKDESAHYERPEKIEAALSMNTDVQIDISSVNGSTNPFYRRRMAGQIWKPGVTLPKGITRVFVFDWRDDPRKNQEWYDIKRRKFESEGMLHIFAQEVDRDYFSAVERILIKAEWVRAAIDAHIKLGFRITGIKIGAQDVADGGGDRNANINREGILAYYSDQWGGEAQEAAKKTIPVCVSQGVRVIYYDCIGVGAGFKAQANTMVANGSCPKSLKILPWDASATPKDPDKRIIPGDPLSPKNEDHFLNFKAQGWWQLRTRFYKTYMAVIHGEKYDPDELISLSSKLPHLHQLEMELSQPTWDTNQAGKMLVDKKPDGSISPNLADATMMCYCPPESLNTIFAF